MSRRRKRKQRNKANKSRNKPPRTPTRTLSLNALELACGHDGFMRGEPEPVLLFGLYTITLPVPSNPQQVHPRAVLRSRALWRFIPPATAYPCTVQPISDAQKTTLQVDVTFKRPNTPLIGLIIGMERDSGDDIQKMYGALERPEAFELWSRGDLIPAPVPLSDLTTNLDPGGAPRRMELLLDGRSPAQLDRDDWVDASAFKFGSQTDDLRVHLRSADGRNDWTAMFTLRG